MMELRPYQKKCVEDTLDGFHFFDKQLVVAPTGAGKAILMAELARRTLPGKTLMLCHREELINQAIEKLHKTTGIFAQKEKAQSSASLHADVVVASVQTMIQRLDKWPKDHFALVEPDESHHCISPMWQKVLNHFDGHAKVCGFTATPDRGDKKNLGKYFENIAFEISLFDLINQGYLSKISVKSIPLKIDLTSVRQTAGDYNETDLGNALTPYMQSIARAIADDGAFRKVLVFLPLIATSKAFTEVCRAEGLNARHVDGTSEDRSEILEWFANTDCAVLNNAMLLTEGYDCPSVDCVVILRPTRSRSLYSQMVGRGTRVSPGKDNLLLLDFLWMHERHSLIRPAHLVAQSEDIAKAMTEAVEKKATGGDGQEELDLQSLESDVRRQREEKLKEELEAKAKRRARTVDAMEFCLSIHESSMADYEPTMRWEYEQPSKGQIEILEGNGIDLGSVKNKGHATKIIDLIIARDKLKLSTPKQIKLLRQFGHPNPDTVSRDQASAFIGKRLSGRGAQFVPNTGFRKFSWKTKGKAA